jgi:hypothetical protein
MKVLIEWLSHIHKMVITWFRHSQIVKKNWGSGQTTSSGHMGNFNLATTPGMVEGTPSSSFLYLIFFFVFIFCFLVLYFFFIMCYTWSQFDWYWHGFVKKFEQKLRIETYLLFLHTTMSSNFILQRNLLQMSVTRWTIFTFFPIFLIGSVYIYIRFTKRKCMIG